MLFDNSEVGKMQLSLSDWEIRNPLWIKMNNKNREKLYICKMFSISNLRRYAKTVEEKRKLEN